MRAVQQIRQRLQAGQAVWGTFLSELRAPGAVQVLADSGLDFVLVDGEHGAYSMDQIRRMLDAARHAGIAAMVRLTLDDRGPVTQALDAGAAGILFPQVRTIDDVRRAVALTKYPPIGQRGAHLLRPHTDFVVPDDSPAFYQAANASLLTAIQIETPESAEIADQIAAVDGVDMLYFGPTDLAANLGAADASDPRIKQIIVKIGKAARAHGKIAGAQVGPIDSATELVELGFSFFGYRAGLVLLADGARGFVDRARKATGGADTQE